MQRNGHNLNLTAVSLEATLYSSVGVNCLPKYLLIPKNRMYRCTILFKLLKNKRRALQKLNVCVCKKITSIDCVLFLLFYSLPLPTPPARPHVFHSYLPTVCADRHKKDKSSCDPLSHLWLKKVTEEQSKPSTLLSLSLSVPSSLSPSFSATSPFYPPAAHPITLHSLSELRGSGLCFISLLIFLRDWYLHTQIHTMLLCRAGSGEERGLYFPLELGHLMTNDNG